MENTDKTKENQKKKKPRKTKIKHTMMMGAGKKEGETVSNSTGCIYNARGTTHSSIQLITFSCVAVA